MGQMDDVITLLPVMSCECDRPEVRKSYLLRAAVSLAIRYLTKTERLILLQEY
jgi:hypothetical protein